MREQMFRGRLPFQLLPLLQLLVVNQRHLCDHGHHCDDISYLLSQDFIEGNVVAGVMKLKNAIHDYFNHRSNYGDDHHRNVMLTNDHGRFFDADLDNGVRDGTAVSCRNVLFARFSWHY